MVKGLLLICCAIQQQFFCTAGKREGFYKLQSEDIPIPIVYPNHLDQGAAN